MNRISNYDKFPKTRIHGYDHHIYAGYGEIAEAILGKTAEKIREYPEKTRVVVVFECYPGVDKEEVLTGCRLPDIRLVIDSDRCAFAGKELDSMLEDDLTQDRVFGVITTKTLDYYFRQEAVQEARQQIEECEGLVVVIGTGASLITEGDILVYCDLARWEIQLRYRAGMSNWNTSNEAAPILTKYKRGFFVEWRLADKLKKKLFSKMDFVLDTNKREKPVMVTGEAFLEGLRQVSRRPFRVQPYFDPGVWGGQWMKEVCDLDRSQENFAWSFDGVPEENSLLMQYGDHVLEVPSIDVVFYCPHELLGEHVHARFGTEFPIRFDFLDTMGGQNLSLQVHPLTEYIQEKFNMRYTQDESYYILDAAQKDTYVYLGVKNGICPSEMMEDLRRAQRGEISFPDEKYINKIPVKKHDHILIPAGTVHCSGANTMVLEISATPYIFTFKLWDWDRVGLDGLPRPIHVDHGEANIQWDRNTDWVMDNLVGQTKLLHKEEGLTVERTGLHNREFLETIRHTFCRPVLFHTDDSVNVLNLVEGEEATVSSPDGDFEPFVVHYAETFIIPATVKDYVITPSGLSEGSTVMTIKASVR